MILSHSIRRTPLPYDFSRGQALSSDFGATGVFSDLLIGIGGNSSFLSDILRKEQTWVTNAVLLEDPLKNVVPKGMGDATGELLRQSKRRVAGYLGLAELSGALTLTQTTQALTDFADQAVEAAFKAALAPYLASGKLPSDNRLFVIAMGKMGACELNYSSDIDLIVMFDDRSLDSWEAAHRRQILVRATRTATKILNDVNQHGYVFRTDLRLRPDPSVTPICVGMTSALDYYESLGRTWERAAFIKARVCAGNREAGSEFLSQMVPFVWRRHLDFAAIEEAHALRLKIRTKTGTRGKIIVPGHDVKLGRGGIREIEFYTQTRQLISGGRDPELRGLQTLNALVSLTSKNWVTSEHNALLQKSYVYLRHVEHVIQMVHDAQTQTIPVGTDALRRVAGLLGMGLDEFVEQTEEHLNSVHSLTEPFFAPGPAGESENGVVEETTITQNWPSYAAMRSQRATLLFEKFRPVILKRLQLAPNPNEALLCFDSFLKGLPAGVQVFSLFSANPKLIDFLTDIIVIAPGLAEFLGRNPGVFDAFLSGEFFEPWPSMDALKSQLSTVLLRSGDYELGLRNARVWTKELHFRIGVHLLQEIVTPDTAGLQYADLAEAVLSTVFEFVSTEFERKHGKINCADTALLAMGSLGAGLMTSTSDLDLILIFDADLAAQSVGRKPLGCRQYFSRLTQALITALTVPMRDGNLYEVDMRLRPSGRAGPVATSLVGFKTYQLNEAWTWEHLALMRARPVAGTQLLCKKIEKTRRAILVEKNNWPDILQCLQDMRKRLAVSKPQKSSWDFKNGPGGIQDIELMAQAIGLYRQCYKTSIREQIISGMKDGHFVEEDLKYLIQSYTLLTKRRILHRLMCVAEGRISEIGTGGKLRLEKIINLEPSEVFDEVILGIRERCADIISNALTKSER